MVALQIQVSETVNRNHEKKVLFLLRTLIVLFTLVVLFVGLYKLVVIDKVRAHRDIAKWCKDNEASFYYQGELGESNSGPSYAGDFDKEVRYFLPIVCLVEHVELCGDNEL